ncbi:stalk domain-containing protein [Paenibacillus sp. strain BS8-2]
MNRKRIKMHSSIAGLTIIALTFSTFGSTSLHAQDMPTTSLSPSLIEQLEQWNKGVYVEFHNPSIGLSEQPRLKDNIMMVPAREMLVGLGYILTWDATDRSLHAKKPGNSRPELLFVDGQSQFQTGGETVAGGTEAYIADDKLWIPLRATVESIGFKVEWIPNNRLAVVTDPFVLPQFRVMTMVPTSEVETPTVLLEELKNKFKLDAEVSWVGPEFYKQKSMVMIAAGDMPSLMLLNDPYAFSDELMRSFAVNPKSVIADYPLLLQLAEDGAGARDVYGEPYMIPRLSDPNHAAFPAIRQDWLSKLGLAIPTTMDELYAVMKAFANNDPDNNLIKDTYGLIGTTIGDHSLDWVEHVFTGSPERFSIKNGAIIDHAVTEHYTKALQWLANAYKERLLDPEFAVIDSEQVQSRIEADHVGISSLTIEQAAERSKDESVWLPLGLLKADTNSSPVAPWNASGSGSYMISTMAKENPAQLLEWLNYGIESTQNDGWSELKGWSDADQAAVNSLFGQPDLLQHNAVLDALPEDVHKLYAASVEQWRKVSYADSAFPEAALRLNQEKYVELNNSMNQIKTKVIMGAMSIEEWTTYQQKLVASDAYRAMMKELKELLQARQ